MLQLVERLVAALMQGRWQREAAADYARMLAAGKAMTHEERDRGLTARGEEARIYYERAMREARAALADHDRARARSRRAK